MGARPVRVAVIGAGFAGLAAATRLLRTGHDPADLVVIEAADGVGGTWWHNRYPGAEVDTPSVLYSFSFAPGDWTRTHARQPELQAYLHRVAEEHGVLPRIRFGTTVTDLRWDEADAAWTLALHDGEEVVVEVVVSAVGFLSTPKVPDLPGLESYDGVAAHSARWPDVDLTGLRVGVLGTGSSAVSVVPAVAREAKSVTVFQRSAGWITPKGDRDLDDEERRRFRSPLRHRWERLRAYVESERGRAGAAQATDGTPSNLRGSQRGLDHLHAHLGDRPELVEALTPGHPYFGKRPVHNDDFYAALGEDHVRLVPHAVTSFEREGPVDATGEVHPLDAVVIATGFRATDYLSGLSVHGVGGVELHDKWAGEPSAYLGMMVPGFPSFFMMYGPATNGSPVVTMLEAEAHFIAWCVSRMRRGAGPAVIPGERYDSHRAWVVAATAGTAWASGDNYFTSASGHVVTQWPSNATWFGWRVLRARREVRFG